MSNFTKSIIYSTTVLAVGLVAIFAIYNNVTTSQSAVSMDSISPAAGENNVSEMVSDVIIGAAESTGAAINNGASMLNDIATSSGEITAELGNDAMEAIEGAAVDTLNPAMSNNEEKAKDAVIESIEAPIEAVENVEVPAEKAVDTLHDAVSH